VVDVMSPFAIVAAPRLPVPAEQLVGHLMLIPAGQCRYRDSGLALLVGRVRLDISQWYGGAWVWLEGDEVADSGCSLGWTQALVHVSACVTDAPAAGYPVQHRPTTPQNLG
jgi:hypothetical protein